MTAPTTSILWPVLAHMTDRFAVALAGVKVSDGWPGDTEVAPEMLWCDDEITTETTYPLASAGRKRRNETITYTWNIRCAERPTRQAAHVRMSELIADVENECAEFVELADIAGIVDVAVTTGRRSVLDTPDGLIGFAQVVVQVDTRLN